MPRPPAAHGTTSRWRTGCRCTPCARAHIADTNGRNRVVADARFPARARRRVLAQLRRGRSPVEAAAAVGLPVQTLYARRRFDVAWARQMDDALMEARDPGVPHGTPTGYRHHGCRCPECRAVHHPVAA